MSSQAERTDAAEAAASRLLTRWPKRPSVFRAHLGLIGELAFASFKLKYAGSLLGYVWSLVKPLMLFGTMYLVFALLLLRGRTNPSENFPVQLLVGIVLWSFFAETTSTSLTAIVANTDMIRKGYFPRWILVVATTVTAAMTLVTNLLLIVVVGLAFHWYQLGLQSLALLPLLLELYVFALAVSLIISAVFVYFRDLGHIWEIVLQLMFFLSAIIYPLSLIPPGLRSLAVINPLAQIIEDSRHVLVSPLAPSTRSLLGAGLMLPIAGVVVLTGAGVWFFQRLSRKFGERL